MPGTPTSVTSCDARARAHAVERVAEDRELVLAADELRARLVLDIDSRACPDLVGQPHRDGIRLSFRLYRGRLAELDRVTRRPIGRLVDEHTVDRRRALQAGGGVDDIARGHPLAGARLGVEPYEHLARRNSDAELEVVLERELPDRERGADGALGIVLVRDGSTEQRHHRVADELLDRAAVALELGAQASVIRAEERLDVLRVHRLGARREADEVAEEDRDDLALSAGHARKTTTWARDTLVTWRESSRSRSSR